MNEMKYIIVDDGMMEKPVIFDDATDHSQMASDLFGFKKDVVSAGFVSFSKDGLQCYGRSVSLNIKSRPEEDSKLINRMLGVPND